VSYGLAGASFNLFKSRDVILFLKTDEGKVEKFKLKSIGVAETSAKRDERTRRISLGTLSVLGTDFSIKNKLKLFLDFINHWILGKFSIKLNKIKFQLFNQFNFISFN